MEKDNPLYFETEGEDRIKKTIEKGTIGMFDYKITSLGTHPCAYIRIPKCYGYLIGVSYSDINLEVHGGLTYSNMDEKGEYWIGWDYGHFTDYYAGAIGNALREQFGAVKWTIERIKEDIQKAIKDIPKLKRKSKGYYFEVDLK